MQMPTETKVLVIRVEGSEREIQRAVESLKNGVDKYGFPVKKHTSLLIGDEKFRVVEMGTLPY